MLGRRLHPGEPGQRRSGGDQLVVAAVGGDSERPGLVEVPPHQAGLHPRPVQQRRLQRFGQRPRPRAARRRTASSCLLRRQRLGLGRGLRPVRAGAVRPPAVRSRSPFPQANTGTGGWPRLLRWTRERGGGMQPITDSRTTRRRLVDRLAIGLLVGVVAVSVGGVALLTVYLNRIGDAVEGLHRVEGWAPTRAGPNRWRSTGSGRQLPADDHRRRRPAGGGDRAPVRVPA